VLPAARTRDEALAYLDLTPCENCGSTAVSWRDAIAGEDGQLVRRYYGTCESCGAARDYRFALPDHPALPGPGDVVYFGGPEPSQLLDAGEWLLIADICGEAGSLPAGTPVERARARQSLAAAAAAMAEVLKFIPAGAGAVPESGFWSVRGRTVRERAPGRFERERLLIMRNAYRDGLDADADPEEGQRPMTDPDPISAAIRAARDGDLAGLAGSVDWELSAAADLARSLPLVFEDDRARVLASGLAEVDAAAGDPDLARDVLEPVRERLAAARAVHPADPALRAATLDRLRVPDAPPGLSAEQAARFDRMRERAAALTDVYVVDTDLGPLPLVVAADSGRLVLLVDD
jgi:hypothetical protein